MQKELKQNVGLEDYSYIKKQLDKTRHVSELTDNDDNIKGDMEDHQEARVTLGVIQDFLRYEQNCTHNSKDESINAVASVIQELKDNYGGAFSDTDIKKIANIK